MLPTWGAVARQPLRWVCWLGILTLVGREPFFPRCPVRIQESRRLDSVQRGGIHGYGPLLHLWQGHGMRTAERRLAPLGETWPLLDRLQDQAGVLAPPLPSAEARGVGLRHDSMRQLRIAAIVSAACSGTISLPRRSVRAMDSDCV